MRLVTAVFFLKIPIKTQCRFFRSFQDPAVFMRTRGITLILTKKEAKHLMVLSENVKLAIEARITTPPTF